MQQSSAKRLEERIQSASKEKNKLEGELMTLQSELKTGKKAKQTLESENTKLSGRLHFISFHFYSSRYSTTSQHMIVLTSKVFPPMERRLFMNAHNKINLNATYTCIRGS